MTMLSQQSIDWWFSPWSYALSAADLLPHTTDILGQRDGYRMWCDKAGVAADLPRVGDPRWEAAFTVSGEELMSTARLFRGLMLAREHNYERLAGLSFADRKWCCSVASTQPLRPVWQDGTGPEEAIDAEGLLDIALRLQHGFPGAWSRLRLTLSPDVAETVDALMHGIHEDRESLDASVARAQRCWRICRARAMEGGGQVQTN